MNEVAVPWHCGVLSAAGFATAWLSAPLLPVVGDHHSNVTPGNLTVLAVFVPSWLVAVRERRRRAAHADASNC
jgi:hypothetical protein